jgi:hypothetical protein
MSTLSSRFYFKPADDADNQSDQVPMTNGFFMERGALRRLTNAFHSTCRIKARRNSLLQSVRLGDRRMLKRNDATRRSRRSSVTPNERLLTPPRSESSLSSPVHKPCRKRPAHFPAVTVGFKSIIIFLTVCTRQRKPLLANDEAAQLIIEAWQAANFWRVGRYVIMPDHIHLFCGPNTFSPATIEKVDRILEKSCHPSMAAWYPGSDLAT